MHVVDGKATITDFNDGDTPRVTFDLSPTFKGQLKSAQRTFTKDSEVSLMIEDEIEISEETEIITWQLITTMSVEITPEGATISKPEYSTNTPLKKLYVENLSHSVIKMNIVSLDPPPLALDRRIENLKRIELKIPVSEVTGGKLDIKIRLKGQKNWREGY